MIGCRPFTENEIKDILNNLERERDRVLFLLGLYTGFRIGELVTLQIKDVFQNNQVVDRIYVNRHNMKGKNSGRSVILHPKIKQVLYEHVTKLDNEGALFPSRKGKGAITVVQAWRILKEAYGKATLTGKLATHSMRKTFAKNVYERLGRDLVKTQVALGHVNINNTISYLNVYQDEIDNVILRL